MRCFPALLSLLIAAGLCACAGPMDSKLVTGDGDAAYFQRLNPLFEKMTPEQQQAFNWSVSDLSIDAINRRYPDATPRQIIHAESALIRQSHPAQIAELQPQLQRHQQLQQQLALLSASKIDFSIEQNFHGLQPYIRAEFHNGSPLSFSTTSWVAKMYLDDASQPVARYSFTLNHRRSQGLLPGESEKHTVHLGFVTGDASWMTLEIRNARKRRIDIQPTQERATDLGERSYSVNDPSARIKHLQAVLEIAQRYQDI